MSAARRSLWWQWTAPVSGSMRFETTGSDFDTVLVIYRGTQLGGLSAQIANDDAGLARTSSVTFDAVAGENYQIAVDGFLGTGGTVVLLGAQLTEGMIYSSNFSGVDGSAGSFADWQELLADGATGVTTDGGVSRSFLSTGESGGDVAAMWLPINYVPTSGTVQQVMISTDWEVVAASGSSPLSFFLLIYSAEQDFLGGLEFDVASSAVLRLDGESRFPTAATFTPGASSRLEILVDRASNRWTVRLGSVVAFENAGFTAFAESPDGIGSLAVAWTNNSAQASVSGMVLLADVSVEKAEVLPTVTGFPYLGLAISIPGRVEAENFDEGGAELAYSDTTSQNQSGAYRTDGVDVEASPIGYHLSWFEASEWLTYTVNVQRSGTYRVDVRVASNGSGGQFRIESDGNNVSGLLTIPDTGGWVAWQTIAFETTLAAGMHRLKLVGVQGNSANGGHVGNVDYLDFIELAPPAEPSPVEPPVSDPPATEPPATEPPSTPVRAPYLGIRASVAGRIEAERFDSGGAGLAYSDFDSINHGGAFRDEEVDIDSGGSGFYLGWFQPGEWSLYSVQVTETAEYRFDVRVASDGQGGNFHLELNGADISGSMTIPDTGGWNVWQVISFTTPLPAGSHDLKLVGDLGSAGNGSNVGNVDWFEISRVVASSPSTPVGTVNVPEPIRLADRIALGWTNQSGAARYEVWRSDSADFSTATRVGMTTAPAFDDASVAGDADYTYWILSYSAEGRLLSTGTVTTGVLEAPSRLVNISSRGVVRPDQPMVAGFVLHGTAPRRVLIRAIGPGLESFGVEGAIEHPAVQIYGSGPGEELASVDYGWSHSENVTGINAAMEEAGAFVLPSDSRDVAMVMVLEPGSYTARVSDATGATGVCLVEVYALDENSMGGSADLFNLSTRGYAGQGGDALIAGLVVSGNKTKRFVIRGAGPSLAGFGVAETINDPEVRIYAEGTVEAIASNDNWTADQATVSAFNAVGAFDFANGGRDAALMLNLAPGVYTVVLAAADGQPGNALVEIYEVP